MNPCQWAGCTRTDTTYADGYWHCPGDLALHYQLTTGKPIKLPAAVRAEQIRPLAEAGLSDRQIADRIGISESSVTRVRLITGIPSQHPQARREFTHGTSSGYYSHRTRGEDPCGPCAAAKSERDAQQHAKRRARRAAKKRSA